MSTLELRSAPGVRLLFWWTECICLQICSALIQIDHWRRTCICYVGIGIKTSRTGSDECELGAERFTIAEIPVEFQADGSVREAD